MRRTTSFELLSTVLLAVMVLTLAAAPNARAASQYTTLFAFTVGHDDGIRPRAGLIFDLSGNLYGTTFGHGFANDGSVYEIAP
jgi:hypothetical protein